MKTFYKLPFSFDADKLKAELNEFINLWSAHFNTSCYEGSWSGVSLRGSAQSFHPLSVEGNGSIIDSHLLDDMSYTREIIEQIQTEKQSIRYLKLGPGSSIKPHKDRDLVFQQGVIRLHIPVLTHPDVIFTVGGQVCHMPAGECWFADFSQEHSVENRSLTDRIHLVIDCEVNKWLHDLFLKGGVIREEEISEDTVYDAETKQAIIESLELLGTETSLKIARDMRSTSP